MDRREASEMVPRLSGRSTTMRQAKVSSNAALNGGRYGRCAERTCNEQKLRVGQLVGARRLEEADQSARQIGGEAGAEHRALRQRQRNAIEPEIFLHRPAAVAAIDDQRRDMVLQILADAGQARS